MTSHPIGYPRMKHRKFQGNLQYFLLLPNRLPIEVVAVDLFSVLFLGTKPMLRFMSNLFLQMLKINTALLVSETGYLN